MLADYQIKKVLTATPKSNDFYNLKLTDCQDPNLPVYILGINSAYHESSVCLIKDGVVVIALEEERLTREKHAKSANVNNPDCLPVRSIELCLEQAGISAQDLHWIAYSFNPDARLKNQGVDEEVTEGDWGSATGESLFHRKLQEVPEKLSRLLGIDVSDKFKWIDHHLTHAASAFFVSPFAEADILVIDGIGEFESTTFYQGKDRQFVHLNSIEYPNSIGFLWEKLSVFLGFSEYDACKVMGLASYGDPTVYYDRFKQFVGISSDGFTLDNTILKFRSPDLSALANILGAARTKDSAVEQKHSDIAAALQLVTEEILVNLVRAWQRQTNGKYLCIAGGVGLNCVANGILHKELPYLDIYIQPASNDAGTALGAAYMVWNQLLERPRSFSMATPYLGPEYSDVQIQAALDIDELVYTKHEDIEAVVAQLLADGSIVAWFQGRMEFGPRALGNRSLLADPRNPNIREIMNVKVKHREHFRPFAPSILAEKATEWFDIPKSSVSSDFMLFAYDAVAAQQAKIPGVVHIDGTSRVQTVRQSSNPKYHKLISEFEKLTGVPIVLNTSFNDSEPIVCSPQNAIETFMKTKIDYLAIGSFLLCKQQQSTTIPSQIQVEAIDKLQLSQHGIVKNAEPLTVRL
jgi:carbamoyltransferase